MKKCLQLFVLVFFISCASEKTLTPQEMIIGKWRVARVLRDGQQVSGLGFRGTYYTFGKDGTMLAATQAGDTVASRYELHGDTLSYIAANVREDYSLDSISKDFFQMSHAIDGISTVLDMVKVPE